MANYTLNLTGQQIDGALNEVHNNVVVKKTAQTFTDAEKSQARTNIGAGAASDVTALQNKVGNTALPTTAQTLTGAVAEHETDITGLGNKTVNGQAIKNNVQLNANNIPFQDSATPTSGSVEKKLQDIDDEIDELKQNIVDNVNTTSYRMQYVLNSTDGLLHIVGTENT